MYITSYVGLSLTSEMTSASMIHISTPTPTPIISNRCLRRATIPRLDARLKWSACYANLPDLINNTFATS